MHNYDKSMFQDPQIYEVAQSKMINIFGSFVTLILVFNRIETSSNQLSLKLEFPNGLSNLESQISMMSNDPEAERRLRDRWNAFVAETTKELDFDLKVSKSYRKFNFRMLWVR